MSARDALFNDIWDMRSATEKNALIDAFAHELAEQIRNEGAYWGQSSAAGKVYRAAAKLIDPEKVET